MKNNRILSLLVGLALVLCMLPSMAFAACGTGDNSTKCSTCGGSGIVFDPECELCEGSGACTTCKGSGICSCAQPCPSCSPQDLAGLSKCANTVLLLNAKTSGNNAVNLSWNKISKADKYVVYGQKCGNDYEKIATTSRTSYTVKKIAGKKLKAHKAYKFYVKAITDNGTVKSKTIHFITGKTMGEYANAKSISVNKKSLALEIGGTAKLKVTTKIYKDKKHISKKHGSATRFVSDNPKVATVNSNGVVTAKSTGTAIIYIQDIGGKYCKTTVTVQSAPDMDSEDGGLTVENFLKDKHLAVRDVFGGDPPRDSLKTLTGKKAFLSEHMTMSIDGVVRYYYDLTFNSNGDEATIPSDTSVIKSGNSYKCTSSDGITCTFKVTGAYLTQIVVKDSKQWDGTYIR